jgi:signal transduction histidine kinase
VLLVLGCLFLPLALFVVDAVRTYRQTLIEGRKDLENTANIFEQHAHNVFESCQLALSLLDEHIRGKSWQELETSAELHNYLAQLIGDDPQLEALAILDAQGYVRVGTSRMPTPAPNYADRGYFIELRAHFAGRMSFERVHFRLNASDKINIARRRSSPDGTFDGVLAVNISPAVAFLDFWRSGPPDTFTALNRDDGRYLVRFPKPDLDLTTLRATTSLLDLAAVGIPTFETLISPVDGKPRITFFQKVHDFPVMIVHGETPEAMIRPWWAALARNAMLYGAATAGLVSLAVLTTLQGRREARTLDQLRLRGIALTAEVATRERAEADLENVMFDMIDRQETDRARIARQLHDSLGQQVALLHPNIDAIARQPGDGDTLRQRMIQQKATATEISQQLSTIAWELRPVWLDDMGLESAIRSFVEVMRTRTELEFSLDIALGDRRFGATVEATIYRTLQEAVTNIIKHAGASHVDILVSVFNGTLRLMIEDNGRGFPPQILASQGGVATPYGGLGLQGMRERLSMIQGSLLIEAEPDNGSALTITVPAEARP